jgi:hypothetical protein
MLKTFREGQLVSLATENGDKDGVVVRVASLIKLEVAVEQSGGDPVFRTVHPKFVTPRDEPGPSDDALHRLIHRAATPGHSAAGGASGRGRRAHTRAAAHRAADR